MTRSRNNAEGIPTSSDPAIDATIVKVLGQRPALRIPEEFAAAVARRALAQPRPSRSAWIGWGPKLAVGSAAVLTAGMFVLAPHALPSLGNGAFYGELVLLGELSGLLLFSHRLLNRD